LQLIKFVPGAWLMIIDGLLWAGLTALALAVMRFLSGPARIDRPASQAGDVAKRAALQVDHPAIAHAPARRDLASQPAAPDSRQT
jgi:hypothetical protein